MVDETLRYGVNAPRGTDVKSKIQQEAEVLARKYISDARKISTSAIDVQSHITDRIRLTERSNQINRAEERLRLDQSLRLGTIGEKQYTQRVEGINVAKREDELRNKYLKNILDQLKTSARDEIRNDNNNVEKQIRESKRVSQLAPEGDEFQIFKETYQKGELERGKRREQQHQLLSGVAGVAGAASRGDVGGVLAAGLGSFGKAGKAGIIGLISKLVYDAITGTVKEVEDNVRGYAVATQTPLGRVRGRIDQLGAGATSLEYTPAEFLRRREQFFRAAGGEFATDDLNLVGAEISRGISPNQLERLVSQGRYGGTRNPIATISSFENFLKDTGRSMVQLPEIMETYLRRADSILQRTGVINSRGLLQTIQGISQSYGVTGTNLDRFTGAFEQGLGLNQNPAIQALQYQTLRELYPEKGLFDLRKTLEDPLSDPKYIQRMLERVQEFSGGNEEIQKFALSALFKGRLSGEDIEKIVAGDFQIPDIQKDAKATTGVDYVKESEKFTSAIVILEKTMKAAAQTAATAADKLREDLNDLKTSTQQLDGTISDAQLVIEERRKEAQMHPMAQRRH